MEENDLLISILAISTSKESLANVDDPVLRRFCQAAEIPSFSHIDLNDIKKGINESPKSYGDLEGRFNFQFYPPFLSATKSLPKENQLFDQTIELILFSYVAWVIQFEKTRSLHNLPLLMEALLNGFDSKYQNLATLAFLHCFQIYAKEKEFSEISLYSLIIRKFFKKSKFFPRQFYELLLEIIRELTYNEMSDDAIDLLINISIQLEENNDLMPLTEIEKMLGIISHHLKAMNLFALDLLSHCMSKLTVVSAINYIQLLASSFLSVLKQEEYHFIAPQSSTYDIYYAKNDLYTPIFDFTSTDVQSVQSDYITLPEDLPTILDTKTLNIIGLIKKCILGREIEFLKPLQFYVHQCENDVSTLYALIESSIQLSDKSISTQFSIFLLSSVLFDPKIVCTPDDQTCITYSTLRSHSINLILREAKHTAVFKKFLNDSISYPLFFSELLLRLLSIWRPSLGIDEELMSIIAEAMLFYQYIHLKDHKDVERARHTIFHFLFSIFKNEEVLTFYFLYPRFYESFLSFAFENSVRGIVENILIKYLKLNQEAQIPAVACFISHLIDVGQTKLPSCDANSFLIYIVQCVNTSISLNYCISKYMIHISGAIFRFIEKIDNEQLLEVVSQFFALTSYQYDMSNEELLALQNAINRITKDKPPVSIIEKFILVSSGNTQSLLSPHFVIKHPKSFAAFFTLFRNFEFDDFSGNKFLFDIVNYSEINCIACHLCNIDIRLLELIKKETLEQSTINLYFDIITKIASIISSHDMVLKFISMISTDVCDAAISCMNKIVLSDAKNPEAYFVFSSKFEKVYNDIHIKNGFTFVCWVRFNEVSQQYNPIIFSAFSPSTGAMIELHIVGDELQFVVKDMGIDYVTNIDAIPTGKWTFLATTIEFKKETIALHQFFDFFEKEPIFIPFPPFLRKKINFIVGGTTEHSVDISYPSYIGPFTLYHKLSSTKVFQILSCGSHHYPMTIKEEPIFSYRPKVNGDLQLSFVAVLYNYFKMDIFIPMFDGVQSQKSLDLMIEFLSNCLLIDKKIETEFEELKGFEVISHLMLSYHPSLINYSLYSRFFTLYQLLKTEDLQNQLFHYILMNFELFIVTDNVNQIRILKHLSSVVWLDSGPLKLSFTDILNKMSFYYVQKNNERSRKPDESLDFSECRSHVSKILEKVFTDDDFPLLSSYLISSNSKEFIRTLIGLFKNIVDNNYSPIRYSKYDIVSPLLLLLVKELDFKVIDVLIIIYKKGFATNHHFSDVCEYIIHQCENSQISKSLFTQIFYASRDMIELLPLISWMGLKIGIFDIFPDISICKKTEMKMFWPVSIMKRLSKEQQSKSIAVLIHCGEQNWMDIIQSISIVFEKDAEEKHLSVINQINRGISKGELKMCEDSVSVFIDIALEYIFTQRNSYIRNIFVESPFNGNYDIDSYTNFGLRITNSFEWLDLGLAINCLDLIRQYRIESPFEKSLCVFVYHFCPEIVENRFEDNNFSTLDRFNILNSCPSFKKVIYKYLYINVFEKDFEELPYTIWRSSQDMTMWRQYDKFRENKKRWKHLIKSLSIQCSPWSSYIGENFSLVRDNTHCYSYCRFKTKLSNKESKKFPKKCDAEICNESLVLIQKKEM